MASSFKSKERANVKVLIHEAAWAIWETTVTWLGLEDAGSAQQ